MPVTFSKNQQNDRALPNNIESTFRWYHAFAGLHDMSFENLYDMTRSGWTLDSGLTAAIAVHYPKYDDDVATFDDGSVFL